MISALWRSLILTLMMWALAVSFASPVTRANLIRNGGFEEDTDGDGLPDHWYDIRAADIQGGGRGGARCLRLRNDKPGLPAHIFQAFALDGSQVSVVTLTAWVKLENVLAGEAGGQEPSLLVHYVDAENRSAGFARMGPWKGNSPWQKMSRRIPVPSSTRDVFLSISMMGATGTAFFDDVSMVPDTDPAFSQNLVDNGDFELGAPDPDGWRIEGLVVRGDAGASRQTVLRLEGIRSSAEQVIGMPLTNISTLSVNLHALGKSLGARDAVCQIQFLDQNGKPYGEDPIRTLTEWQGTFDWRPATLRVRVPQGSAIGVIRFSKLSREGVLGIDDVQITGMNGSGKIVSRPTTTSTDTNGWFPYVPVESIKKGSALDVSFLLDSPAGKHGFVKSQNGRFVFDDGTRAHFLGVTLIPPTAFVDNTHVRELADRLATSGMNLVRLAYIDDSQEPFGCLFDPNEDDTQHFSAENLDRLDFLIAALKARGIYVSFELLSARRFREGDNVDSYRELMPAGMPACAFDDRLIALQKQTASDLFNHVNPYTKIAYKNEPAIAFVAPANGRSILESLNDPASTLPQSHRAQLEALYQKWRSSKSIAASEPSRRQFSADVVKTYFDRMASHLRSIGVRIPVAGIVGGALVSGSSSTYIEDHLSWRPPAVGDPETMSIIRSAETAPLLVRSRQSLQFPYVLSEWGEHGNRWCDPYEFADLMWTTFFVWWQDWDGFVPGGIFRLPRPWGDHIIGTVASDEWETIPFVTNSKPQVFNQLPNAALLFHRDRIGSTQTTESAQAGGLMSSRVHEWDPWHGVFLIHTPHSRCASGLIGGRGIELSDIDIESNTRMAAITVSSLTTKPISESPRLLVTAVARAEQRGMTYRNFLKREAISFGEPPILMEPVEASIRLKGTSGSKDWKVFSLLGDGSRHEEVPIEVDGSGLATIKLSWKYRAVHYEILRPSLQVSSNQGSSSSK